MENTIWILGDGATTKFWLDSWFGSPLADSLHNPQDLHNNLQEKVQDFILNFKWSIPFFFQACLKLQLTNNQESIPMKQRQDNLIWIPFD